MITYDELIEVLDEAVRAWSKGNDWLVDLSRPPWWYLESGGSTARVHLTLEGSGGRALQGPEFLVSSLPRIRSEMGSGETHTDITVDEARDFLALDKYVNRVLRAGLEDGVKAARAELKRR